MKHFIPSLYISLLCLSLLFTSCELAQPLDDYEPLYSLDAETAIADETSAELALTGMYSVLLQQSVLPGNPNHSMLPSRLSITGQAGYFANGADELAIDNNDALPEGRTLEGSYNIQYTLINRANWVIEKVGELPDNEFSNPSRKQEIIAEAKAMRALGHLHLLRLWGQFYDTSSPLGIDVRLEPARSAEAQPRESVAETYAAILQDLDDAIANAPDLRAKYFVNKTFAKGLKAKVLLYSGDYAQAAAIAKDVIDNSGPNFALTPTFEELFDHSTIATLDNTEALFCVYADEDEGLGNGNFWDGLFAQVSNTYVNLAQTGTMNVNGQTIRFDTTRVAFVLTGTGFLPFLNGNMKFKQRAGGSFETLYHLRMAEVYLIFAEASARSTGSVTPEALDALNTVRIRAGATSTGEDGFETYPEGISLDQFLQAVRIEKMMELATETGEDWFDLVRYDYADGFGTGFQVSDVKATATNSDKFILPIPIVTIDVGGGVIEQNPSY